MADVCMPCARPADVEALRRQPSAAAEVVAGKLFNEPIE